ncbi:MAG TPA: hypothetical protein PKY87_08705 [Terricaulis sp.]|nr:hypothetical protein [Terricaulis sp.]
MSPSAPSLPVQAGQALLRGAAAFGSALLLLAALFAQIDRVDGAPRAAVAVQAASAPVTARSSDQTPLAAIGRALSQWAAHLSLDGAPAARAFELAPPARLGRSYQTSANAPAPAAPRHDFHARGPPPVLRAA